MKKILSVVALVMTVVAPVSAEVETTIGADVVSSYIWRGTDCGSAAIQPSLSLECGGLGLSFWGSYGLVNPADTKEFDLTLAYTVGGFNIGITDYWFNDPEKRYFLYDANKTSHVFEANIGYDFGVASIQWFTNFAGNDGLNKSGKRAYSSYFELSAPFKLATVDWSATVGAVPYATDFYGVDGFAVTNLALKATKDIKVTDSFSIPVFAQVAANPSTQKAYLVFGFTITK